MQTNSRGLARVCSYFRPIFCALKTLKALFQLQKPIIAFESARERCNETKKVLKAKTKKLRVSSERRAGRSPLVCGSCARVSTSTCSRKAHDHSALSAPIILKKKFERPSALIIIVQQQQSTPVFFLFFCFSLCCCNFGARSLRSARREKIFTL